MVIYNFTKYLYYPQSQRYGKDIVPPIFQYFRLEIAEKGSGTGIEPKATGLTYRRLPAEPGSALIEEITETQFS